MLLSRTLNLTIRSNQTFMRNLITYSTTFNQDFRAIRVREDILKNANSHIVNNIKFINGSFVNNLMSLQSPTIHQGQK